MGLGQAAAQSQQPMEVFPVDGGTLLLTLTSAAPRVSISMKLDSEVEMEFASRYPNVGQGILTATLTS